MNYRSAECEMQQLSPEPKANWNLSLQPSLAAPRWQRVPAGTSTAGSAKGLPGHVPTGTTGQVTPATPPAGGCHLLGCPLAGLSVSAQAAAAHPSAWGAQGHQSRWGHAVQPPREHTACN